MARKRSGVKSNEVYEELKRRIISLRIPPGQILMEAKLCEEFTVSRTPVREAIIKLIQEGFLVEDSGRVYVVHLTLDDVREIYEVREALERYAVKLAMQFVTEDFVESLKDINQKLGESLTTHQYQDFFHLDEQFHKTVVQACGNNRIIDILSNHAQQVGRIRQLTVLDPSRMQLTIIEHEEIIRGFELKDSEIAQNAIIKHLEAVLQTIEKFGDLAAIINARFHSSDISLTTGGTIIENYKSRSDTPSI